MLSVAARRRDRIASNMVRDTKTAVKMLETRPKNSVVANPWMGPDPNWNRNAAAMSDATCVSMIVSRTRSNPAGDGSLHALGRPQLLLDPFEDQHVGVDADADRQDEPRDPRQCQHRADVGHAGCQNEQVHADGHDGVDPGDLVVHEHEERDQDQTGHGRRDPRANRIGAQRGADGPLLEVGQRRGKRARTQLDLQVFGLLLRDPGDLPAVGDTPLQDRRRLHLPVEDNGELPADILPADVAELARALSVEREAHRRLVELIQRRTGVPQVAAGHGGHTTHEVVERLRRPAGNERVGQLGHDFHVRRHDPVSPLEQQLSTRRRPLLDDLQLE